MTTTLTSPPETTADIERAALAEVAKWTAELSSATTQADAARAELGAADLADLAAADALADRVQAAERRAGTATALRDAARQRLTAAQRASALDAAQQLRAVADAAWAAHLQHTQHTADLLAALADHEGHDFAPAGRWPGPTTSDQLHAAAEAAETQAADATVPLLGAYAAVRPGPVTGRDRDVLLVGSGPLRSHGEVGSPVTYRVLVDGERHARLPLLQSSPQTRVQLIRVTVPATAVVTLAAEGASDTFDPATLAGTD